MVELFGTLLEAMISFLFAIFLCDFLEPKSRVWWGVEVGLVFFQIFTMDSFPRWNKISQLYLNIVKKEIKDFDLYHTSFLEFPVLATWKFQITGKIYLKSH